MTDPRDDVDALTSCETPFLIGIRHHSPVCAAAVPAMLERFEPDRILLELPPEFQPWVEWLGHAELQAPVALAAADRAGHSLAFYPMADFSPELAAIRWAARRGIPVEAFDRSLQRGSLGEAAWTCPSDESGLLRTMYRREGVHDFEELWDRLVEARSVAADAEAIRAAGLMLGWALRVDALAGEGIEAETLAREACMRARIEASEGRVAAVVGSFHAAALLPTPVLWRPLQCGDPPTEGEPAVTSLIPYSHDLLDSRSGYPAGIRDPQWQQWVWQHADDRAALDRCMATVVSRVCARMRTRGHVAGVPDALETVRVVRDLVRLRRLPAPGRRELLEAVQLTLGRGESMGRGQQLGHALEREMVGATRGRLAPQTPRSGLAPHTESLLESLGLPGPTSDVEPKEWVLDPWRADLDRRRHVTLTRLSVCAIPYATETQTQGLGAGDAITRRWTVAWTPSTAAMLELVGMRGATLVQATLGAVMADERRLREEERYDCAAEFALLEQCAHAGLPEAVAERLDALRVTFVEDATLPRLIDAIVLCDRIARGHVPGLPRPADASAPDAEGAVAAFEFPDGGALRETLLAAALRTLSGLAGSEDVEDAIALAELVRLYQNGEHALGGGRLGWAVDAIAQDGTPFMQGAGLAAQCELDRVPPDRFATRVGGWISADEALAARLRGALVVAPMRFESDPVMHDGLIEHVNALGDEAFMRRLPRLRDAFDVLGAGTRQRLLDALGERIGVAGAGAELDDAPEHLARWAAADIAARARLDALDLGPPPATSPPAGDVVPLALRAHAIAPLDRWRLILGRQRRRLPAHARSTARALDELYGRGRRRGVAGDGPGQGGGQEDGYPNVRAWNDELEALFGADIREEILGRAAEQGRSDVLGLLDPDEVTPSVELLQQVLSLRGSLGEAQLAKLRPLVARIIEQLVATLSQRLRPALSGLATPRPSRRPSGPPDLRRTIRANLRTVREAEDGQMQLVPERMIFRTRAQKSLDWHLILVVDVSGSMEPSVIYSALMAAILSGLPALSVTFLAFNTQVIDMTEHVDDPLSLLLEVEIGGGTHIARGLRAAADRLTVPKRTMVVLLSDFEEGWPVGALIAQVRALVETGARCLGLAALDDHGQPRCAQATAERVAAAGMPVAALSPMQLARWVGEQIR